MIKRAPLAIKKGFGNMSSENKKSLGSLIILFILFALVAGISWVYFGKGSTDVVQESKQGLTDKVSAAMSHEGHDHSGHDHSGHDHGKKDAKVEEASATAEKEIGTKGKVFKLDPPAIYGTRAVGNPDAPIKIQEFYSLTCNHCASFHSEVYPKLKKNLIDTGQVYFEYHEMPLNGPALYGSMIARCLPEARYGGFVDILLKDQDKWAFGGDFKGALMQHAKLAGMSEAEFNTCYNNKELQQAIAANIKTVSETWKINSTPSFVVNDGERILYGGQPYENFEKLVQQLLGPDAQVAVDAETVAPTTEDPTTDATSIIADTKAQAAAVAEPAVEVDAPIEKAGDEIQNVIEKSMDVIEDTLE